MLNMDELLFSRSHFPAEARELKYPSGTSLILKETSIPPYHPSMAEAGIDIDLTLSLLDGALEQTLLDFKEVQHVPSVKRMLEGLKHDKATGKLSYGTPVREDMGVLLDPFPFTGALYLERLEINPMGYNVNFFVKIEPGEGTPSFAVPSHVSFSHELMREYEMIDDGISIDRRRIRCPYTWTVRNTTPVQRVFYKNLVIAIDNAVVRRKYLR